MGTSREAASLEVGAEEMRAAARSSIYGLFQDAFAYPKEETREALAAGELVELLREALARAEVDFTPAQEQWRTLQEVSSAEDLAMEYTRLFDTGASGPPCPLYGGLYGGDRLNKLEEMVRFYNHFGLTTAEEVRELPDHLPTQLEFMHYLSYREAEALHAGRDAGPYRRAQRDFAERNLESWVPKLYARLQEHQANDFFLSLVKIFLDFLAWDIRTLKAYQ